MKYIKTQLFPSAPNSMKVAKQLTKKFSFKGKEKEKYHKQKLRSKRKGFFGQDWISLLFLPYVAEWFNLNDYSKKTNYIGMCIIYVLLGQVVN